MKNKKSIKVLLSVFAVILVVVLLLTAVGPQLVLKVARQPEVAESYAYSENF
jgi:hypothetical protein